MDSARIDQGRIDNAYIDNLVDTESLALSSFLSFAPKLVTVASLIFTHVTVEKFGKVILDSLQVSDVTGKRSSLSLLALLNLSPSILKKPKVTALEFFQLVSALFSRVTTKVMEFFVFSPSLSLKSLSKRVEALLLSSANVFGTRLGLLQSLSLVSLPRSFMKKVSTEILSLQLARSFIGKKYVTENIVLISLLLPFYLKKLNLQLLALAEEVKKRSSFALYETVTYVDLGLSRLHKWLVQFINLIDLSRLSIRKWISESLLLASAKFFVFKVSFLQTLSLVSASTRRFLKQLYQSLALEEMRHVLLSKIITVTLYLQDLKYFLGEKVLAQTMTLVALSLSSFWKQMHVLLGLVDDLFRSLGILKEEMLETVDSLVLQPFKFIELLGTLFISDVRRQQIVKQVDQSILFSDFLQKHAMFSLLGQLLVLDQVALLSFLYVSLSESLLFVMTVNLLVSFRRMLTEVLSTIAVKIVDFRKQVTESKILLPQLSKFTRHPQLEILNFVDFLRKTEQVLRTIPLSIEDLVLKHSQITRTEISGLTSILAKIPTSLRLEHVVLSDLVVKSSQVSLFQILALVELVQKLTKTVRAETKILVDNFWKACKVIRIESMSLASVIVKALRKLVVVPLQLSSLVKQSYRSFKVELASFIDAIIFRTSIRKVELLRLLVSFRTSSSRILVEIVHLLGRPFLQVRKLLLEVAYLVEQVRFVVKLVVTQILRISVSISKTTARTFLEGLLGRERLSFAWGVLFTEFLTFASLLSFPPVVYLRVFEHLRIVEIISIARSFGVRILLKSKYIGKLVVAKSYVQYLRLKNLIAKVLGRTKQGES